MSDNTETNNKSKLPLRAVLYTDGSAKPTNPGKIGWSVHGYTFAADESSKGAGHPKVVPTVAGYLEKSPATKCVELINYYDYVGWSPKVTTNNAAEVLGCAQALRYASALKSLKHVHVFTDSMYVVNGINDHIHKWVANNWIKRDGTPVQNQDEWREVLNWTTALKDNNTKVKVEWVKGHGTNFGNIRADFLAGIGSATALLADERGGREMIKKSEGYWKSESERHPLLGLRGWFFTVNPEYVVRGEYFLCNQVKSDEFIGSRSVDGSFGYVKLKEEEPLLELVRERQLEVAREFETLALARIDRIFDKAVCSAIETFGKIVLATKRYSNNLHFINEDHMVRPNKDDEGAEKSLPITEELYPPKLALRCIGTISKLKEMVEIFMRGDHTKESSGTLVFHDITDEYFEKTPSKKGTPVWMFKKSIKVPDQSISMTRHAFGREIRFQQIFGIHMLGRNNLKRLEMTDVQMWLVVEKTSDFAVRYHTVIKSNDDWSAWSGSHSNLIVFDEKLQ